MGVPPFAGHQNSVRSEGGVVGVPTFAGHQNSVRSEGRHFVNGGTIHDGQVRIEAVKNVLLGNLVLCIKRNYIGDRQFSGK